MSLGEFLQLWIVAFFTLALFSFLYKDNPFYKIAEHIFAGISAGYYIGLVWNSIIIQQMLDPMFKDGKWYLIIPGFLGILMFSRFFRGIHWVSRLSLAFVMGTTAGIFLISELHGKILPQIQATMLPFNNSGGLQELLLAIVVVVGVLTTLIYFYFSKEHKGLLGAAAKTGIWFIMISFGAHFGYTVMARISLLIGRVQFLIEDWGGSMVNLFT